MRGGLTAPTKVSDVQAGHQPGDPSVCAMTPPVHFLCRTARDAVASSHAGMVFFSADTELLHTMMFAVFAVPMRKPGVCAKLSIVLNHGVANRVTSVA